ncbi:ornithine cyclodeaminase family protein [Schnuerera sp. xch1]|uniref:ornithine cyclodeaminase family protein n=1 Tax=Schnuerera sp. xch1 TaxID=2874283 RepID=UPI001CBF09CD|nr:ornithine cyclodeaminase family protein [Schnuerera sp. xch1]MBZ2174039.1 ornithine cyclodeaminase family protein [Schnuerera sp. xch1]
MKIVVLNQNDMKRVFSMEEAIQADKDALELYSLGKSVIPLRVNIDVPKHEGQSLYMPGYVANANALGVKIISVYPKNIEKGLVGVPATMVLKNSETGEVCSLMDGTCLTQIRTGAVSGAAMDLLARKDSKVFALFGTGGQAKTQLEAILTVRPIEIVKVFDINMERAENFASRMTEAFGEKFDVKIITAKSSAEAIEDADIITSVTTTKTPAFDGRLVKRGCHINGVGSYTPEMHELDEYIITHADKVYVDTRDGVLNESGDLIIPINKGIYSGDKITGELGEVIAGKAPGRANDDEITIFKTTGSAVLDLVTAQRIYESAIEKGIGSIIEF